MVLRKYIELDAIVFILFGAAIGYFLLIHSVNTNKQMLVQNFQTIPIGTANPTIAPMPTPTPTPTPTPIPKTVVAFVPTVATTSQISSDGTKKVIVKIIQKIDTTQTYEVSVADNGPVIFSKSLAAGSSITIPFNTWSSGDHYFFLQENTGKQTNIMVFNANGEAFANGAAYLDLTGDFTKRATGDIFDEATGWAADNLIVINTKLSDNTQGPSYWFEVPSESIIQLSTKF